MDGAQGAEFGIDECLVLIDRPNGRTGVTQPLGPLLLVASLQQREAPFQQGARGVGKIRGLPQILGALAGRRQLILTGVHLLLQQHGVGVRLRVLQAQPGLKQRGLGRVASRR